MCYVRVRSRSEAYTSVTKRQSLAGSYRLLVTWTWLGSEKQGESGGEVRWHKAESDPRKSERTQETSVRKAILILRK